MKTVTDNVIDIERTVEDALEANSVTKVIVEKNTIEIEIGTPRAFVRLFPKQDAWKIEKSGDIYVSYDISVRDGTYNYTAHIGSQDDFDEFCEIYNYEYVTEEATPDEVEDNAETL